MNSRYLQLIFSIIVSAIIAVAGIGLNINIPKLLSVSIEAGFPMLFLCFLIFLPLLIFFHINKRKIVNKKASFSIFIFPILAMAFFILCLFNYINYTYSTFVPVETSGKVIHKGEYFRKYYGQVYYVLIGIPHSQELQIKSSDLFKASLSSGKKIDVSGMQLYRVWKEGDSVKVKIKKGRFVNDYASELSFSVGENTITIYLTNDTKKKLDNFLAFFSLQNKN